MNSEKDEPEVEPKDSDDAVEAQATHGDFDESIPTPDHDDDNLDDDEWAPPSVRGEVVKDAPTEEF